MSLTAFRLATALTILLVACPSPAEAQDPHFRFTNRAGGANISMDVGNVAGQPANLLFGTMQKTSNVSGQYWRITSNPAGGARLTNTFTGKLRCLDVAGDGSLYMDTCGQQIGQRWNIEAVPFGVRVTNVFMPGRCLDTLSGNGMTLAVLTPCNNSQSQTWLISLTGTVD